MCLAAALLFEVPDDPSGVVQVLDVLLVEVAGAEAASTFTVAAANEKKKKMLTKRQATSRTELQRAIRMTELRECVSGSGLG